MNITYENTPDVYLDFRKALDLLKNTKDTDYSYPDIITNFHIYTEVKTEKELECVKSYFATQDLKRTKLIIWSDYDISEQCNLKPYKDTIDFRIYNAVEEARNTILENCDKLQAIDGKYYQQSDLLRILILHKYGGVWIDMDVILLRDFKPILDQEYLYQWGMELDFINEGCCGSVMSVKKHSTLSFNLLKELINMPTTGGGTTWGKDLFAKVYSRYKFNILPGAFFNLEWGACRVLSSVEYDNLWSGWFENDCLDDNLFLDCFAWHWHNTSYKDKQIIINSKFDKLRKITNSRLEERKKNE